MVHKIHPESFTQFLQHVLRSLQAEQGMCPLVQCPLRMTSLASHSIKITHPASGCQIAGFFLESRSSFATAFSFAAMMKSFSVRPPLECVMSSTVSLFHPYRTAL